MNSGLSSKKTIDLGVEIFLWLHYGLINWTRFGSMGVVRCYGFLITIIFQYNDRLGYLKDSNAAANSVDTGIR